MAEMLGHETSFLPREREEQAVLDILQALTEAEKAQIPDPRMIIRHVRAEKVRLVMLFLDYTSFPFSTLSTSTGPHETRPRQTPRRPCLAKTIRRGRFVKSHATDERSHRLD